MSTTAQQIVDRAQVTLVDVAGVRWPDAELLSAVSDAQREICAVRLDAYTKLANIPLVAGTRQSLPADGLLLVELTRNMGSGSTPGAALRKVPRQLMDAQTPGWHTTTPAAVASDYTYDPLTPKTFYVYPPSTGSVQVEALYGALPPAMAALTDTLSIDDTYAIPVLDYVLYRAFLKDGGVTGSLQRAAVHRQAFDAFLSVKAQSDAAATTKRQVED